MHVETDGMEPRRSLSGMVLIPSDSHLPYMKDQALYDVFFSILSPTKLWFLRSVLDDGPFSLLASGQGWMSLDAARGVSANQTLHQLLISL